MANILEQAQGIEQQIGNQTRRSQDCSTTPTRMPSSGWPRSPVSGVDSAQQILVAMGAELLLRTSRRGILQTEISLQ